MSATPSAFISYSWSSPEHQEWVLSLASQLQENGVAITLDKWDLKEGNDAIHFMEKMVTDPSIEKVIVVLDRVYAEKADGRAGGVGKETQIISAELYEKTDQKKFVGVIAEVDPEGKPFLPTFYKSRIYIDLSSQDAFAKNFDQLLRWLFDKPSHVRPPLGKPPAFLEAGNLVVLPTQTRARRATEFLRVRNVGSAGALEEYFGALVDGLESFRIVWDQKSDMDDLVISSIKSFLPYRNEFIEVMATAARHWDQTYLDHVHRFLERALKLYFRPAEAAQWTDMSADNFYVLVHELFLYSVAILLRFERFNEVNELFCRRYYLGDVPNMGHMPMVGYNQFRQYARSLDLRNRKLNPQKLSLHATLLEERSPKQGTTFMHLMQADFLLFMRDSVLCSQGRGSQDWWPETLVYSGRSQGPFEMFARSESAAYFARVAPLLQLQTKQELEEVVAKFSYEGRSGLHIPRWEYNRVEVAKLLGLKSLGTAP